MARLFERVEYGEVETELTLLGSPDGEYVGPDRAAKVLKYVRRNLHDLTVPAMGRILSYDVAALRAEAIELWLSAPRDDDELIIARIFGDEHPSCALGALRGSVAGWSEYSELRRAVVLAGMRSLARNTVCAAAMLNRLVLFDRVEITGQNPPWVIFEELITVVMQGLSHNAVFVDARLFNVVRVAAKVLSPTSVAVVCDAWISWLERNEAAKKLPSEFSLGVIEILLSSTFQEPWLRKNMIDRMLSFQSTGAMVAFVADLVDGWETLLDEEKNAVLTRLDTGRTDDLWLQAAAITRSIVPEPVQRVVLGNQVALTDGAEALVSKVPMTPECGNTHYSGRPQPLWWLGTHHGGRGFGACHGTVHERPVIRCLS